MTIGAIWKTRNKKVLSPSYVDTKDLYQRVIFTIKNRVLCEQSNHKVMQLQNIWALNNVLRTYDDDKLRYMI